MNKPDNEGYFRFIEDTNKREMSNAETYDKSLLTLSSVLLGLSLTFTQNVVPLQTATKLWLLLCSWALFSFTIIIVMVSFIYAQNAFHRLKLGARKYYLEGDSSSNNLSEQIYNNIRNINALSGMSFIIAIVLFTVFVGINVSGESIVSKDKKQEEISQTPYTYEQQQTKPIKQPEQTTPQKPRQESKK
jgi:hypothetical protein